MTADVTRNRGHHDIGGASSPVAFSIYGCIPVKEDSVPDPPKCCLVQQGHTVLSLSLGGQECMWRKTRFTSLSEALGRTQQA